MCVESWGFFFVSFHSVYLTRAKLCRLVAEQVNRSMATTKLFVAQLQSLHTHTSKHYTGTCINRHTRRHTHAYAQLLYVQQYASELSKLSL